MGKRGERKPTIIRREEIVAGGHHGGAWKVAYADFVTAMMAFFLLMWLLNATTEQQRRGIADYFSAQNQHATAQSGEGRPLGGTSPFKNGDAISDRGAPVTMHDAPPVPVDDDDSDTPAREDLHAPNAAVKPDPDAPDGPRTDAAHGRPTGGAAVSAAHEERAFRDLAQAIQRAVAADPDLASIAKQLSIDLTPEGLRIQIRDDERQPMFATGSADPNDKARALLARIAPALERLPEPVSIAGYTDAAPYAGTGRTNWDLSADRANATRRLLTEAGLPEARIRDVTGHADRDLLLPRTPLAAANRRIAITVLRAAPAPAPAR